MKVDKTSDVDMGVNMNFDTLLGIARRDFRQNAHYELDGSVGPQTLWTAALFAAERVLSCQRAIAILLMGSNHYQVDGEQALHLSPVGGESQLEVLRLLLANQIVQVLQQDFYLIAKGAGASERS